jgi:hypothetical protein
MTVVVSGKPDSGGAERAICYPGQPRIEPGDDGRGER